MVNAKDLAVELKRDAKQLNHLGAFSIRRLADYLEQLADQVNANTMTLEETLEVFDCKVKSLNQRINDHVDNHIELRQFVRDKLQDTQYQVDTVQHMDREIESPGLVALADRITELEHTQDQDREETERLKKNLQREVKRIDRRVDINVRCLSEDHERFMEVEDRLDTMEASGVTKDIEIPNVPFVFLGGGPDPALFLVAEFSPDNNFVGYAPDDWSPLWWDAEAMERALYYSPSPPIELDAGASSTQALIKMYAEAK